MNRTVVISGGGTGIGRAIASRFAIHGDRVLIIGRRADVLHKAAEYIASSGASRDLHSRRVEVAAVDLTQPDQVQSFVDDRFPVETAVDVLVNAAGSGGPPEGTSLSEVAAAWEQTLRANVLTAVLLTTALEPRLRRPGGRVINFSSIAALRGGGTAYAAAKAALHGWSYTLAGAFGPEGITVNVIAPGFIDSTELFGDTMTDERRQRLITGTLVGRAGHPDDVAAAVDYLAPPEASYITGQVLQINGGALLGR